MALPRIHRLKRLSLWVPMIDGGWGWIVVLGAFLIHVFADGITYSFGTPLARFMEEFHCTNSEASLVACLLFGITLSAGPLASAVANKWGCRRTAFAGSIIATIGCAASLKATSIQYLMVSAGAVLGFGIGFMYCPAIIMVTLYFEKKRAMATGIAVCGAGIGTLVISPLANFVIESYGWRAVFYLYGLIVILCGFCAATFRPLPFVKIGSEEEMIGMKEAEVPLDSSKENDTVMELRALAGKCLRPSLSYEALHSDLIEEPKEGRKKASSLANIFARPTVMVSTGFLGIKDLFYAGSLSTLENEGEGKYRSIANLTPQKEEIFDFDSSTDTSSSEVQQDNWLKGIFRSISTMLDWKLLVDPVFIVFASASFLTSIGFNAPLTFLPAHGRRLGFSPKRCSYLLSAFGSCNTVGQVLLGIMADRKLPTAYGKDLKKNRLWIYIISLSICGTITCLVFLCKTYWSLMVYAGLYGLTLSSFVTLTSVLLVDLLGLEKLTSAFGLILLFQGTATFIGPPLSTSLADMVKNYDLTFTFCGICILMSAALLTTIPLIQKRREAARQRKIGSFLFPGNHFSK